MVTLLHNYELGDMQVRYYIDSENKNVECMLLPVGMEPLEWEQKHQFIDGLVQVKVAGDTYLGGYAGGNTMRQGETVTGLAFQKQYVDEKIKHGKKCTAIHTLLQDAKGREALHTFEWMEGSDSILSYVNYKNTGNKQITLEALSSFSLGGISPFVEGDAHDTLLVHRLRSVWSMEGRLETRTMEELQLEPSWAGHAVRAERFGQVGSMAVNHYFPYLVVEDSKNHVFWGAQLAHNASWQMELYRKDDGVAISGGLADREYGHWMKHLAPGESITTPTAILSVCIQTEVAQETEAAQGKKNGKNKSSFIQQNINIQGIDRISQRMTEALQPAVEEGPESEQSLPIIFNEYCTTWGCPSHENITEILHAIKDKGFSYFVIDCGWYKEDGIPWDIAMGDYQVSKELFPDGLEKTVSAIRAHGMKPGIWFEIENVGSAAKAYHMEDHLLKRDDQTLTTTMRRFWDMRDPWVQNYLTDKVIGTLQKYHFDYMKIDCNDTIGLGCDGAESLGEGLRQDMAASMDFIRKVKKEVPGIIIENCASGGHRLEPLMMSESSMASFSDAHECEEIPIIAANLHRAILPRQSQIWSVIRKEDSLKRIAYSVANTFLGRMCISGDVLGLSEDQWSVLDGGIAFYQKIAPIIKNGYSYRFGTEIGSYRNPEGWQGILRVGKSADDKRDAYAVIHTFHGVLPDRIEIPLPESIPGESERYTYQIADIYSDTETEATIRDNKLCYVPTENSKAVAVYLRRIKL